RKNRGFHDFLMGLNICLAVGIGKVKGFQTLLEGVVEVAVVSQREKGLTFLQDTIQTGGGHEEAGVRFFLFEYKKFIEIIRYAGKKSKIGIYILSVIEGVFRQKDGQLGLYTGQRRQRFVIQ